MIGVIAPVRGKVKRHGKPLLAGCQTPSVKRIGFLGGGKTGILADGPGPSGIHGGLGASHIRRQPRQGIYMLQAFNVFGGVHRLNRDTIRCQPV